MNELEKKLEVMIDKEFVIIHSESSTIKEKKEAQDRITILAKLWDEASTRALKQEALKSDNKLQWAKLCVEVFGISGNLIFWWVWMNKGLKFEETGTIASSVFKGLIGKFKFGK